MADCPYRELSPPDPLTPGRRGADRCTSQTQHHGTGSTAIYTSHDESLLSQIVIEGSTGTHASRAPGIEHLLAARTGILEEDDRILLAGIEIYRLHHPSVELHASDVVKVKVSRLPQLYCLVFSNSFLLSSRVLITLPLLLRTVKTYGWL